MTMKGRPSSSPSSWMVQMCGWVRAEASRASRSNRVSHGAWPCILLAQELDRDLAVEAQILRAVDDTHAALAELVEHAVVGDDRLGHGWHRSLIVRGILRSLSGPHTSGKRHQAKSTVDSRQSISRQSTVVSRQSSVVVRSQSRRLGELSASCDAQQEAGRAGKREAKKAWEASSKKEKCPAPPRICDGVGHVRNFRAPAAGRARSAPEETPSPPDSNKRPAAFFHLCGRVSDRCHLRASTTSAPSASGARARVSGSPRGNAPRMKRSDASALAQDDGRVGAGSAPGWQPARCRSRDDQQQRCGRQRDRVARLEAVEQGRDEPPGPQAQARPGTTPVRTSPATFRRTRRTTDPALAPSAIRMPISALRLFTA